jgi:hypothetical protein
VKTSGIYWEHTIATKLGPSLFRTSSKIFVGSTVEFWIVEKVIDLVAPIRTDTQRVAHFVKDNSRPLTVRNQSVHVGRIELNKGTIPTRISCIIDRDPSGPCQLGKNPTNSPSPSISSTTTAI